MKPYMLPKPVLPRPYSEEALDQMTDSEWASIQESSVPVSDLIPTQECVVIDRLVALVAGEPSEGGDTCGRAVSYLGKLYAHDGHHRLILAWLNGCQRVGMRVKEVSI